MIENLSDQPLYVTIFDLGPSWQIINMISGDGGDDYEVVPAKRGAKGSVKISWEMIVPDSFRKRGLNHCEDVIKVFVTNH